MLCSKDGVEIDYLSGFVSEGNIRELHAYCIENTLGNSDAQLNGFVGNRYRMRNGSAFLHSVKQNRDRFGAYRDAEEMYIQVSSSFASDIALLVRESFRPTRLDLNLDIVFEDDEMSVKQLALLAEEQLRCKQVFVSSSKSSTDGDTLYLKDRRSSFFFRIYEKGKKESYEVPFVRFEVQVNRKLASSVWSWIQEGRATDIFLQLWNETTEGKPSFSLFGKPSMFVDLEYDKHYAQSVYENIERQILPRIRKLYGYEDIVYELLHHIMKEMSDEKRYSFSPGFREKECVLE